MTSRSIFRCRGLSALMPFAIAACAAVSHLPAQTTFTQTSTFSNYITGAAVYNSGTGLGGMSSTNTAYSHAGTAANNITPLIFGQSFQVAANGTATQGGTAAWGFDGTIGGSAIPALTAMPISYSFNLAKTSGITSDVTWNLVFRGASNSEVSVASGTMSGSSSAISGTGSYTFTSGAMAANTYRAYLEVAFTTNVATSQGLITVTMNDTGFGGQGITLNASAIPEPSTYAAIAGAAMLGLAVWRRRRQAAAARVMTA